MKTSITATDLDRIEEPLASALEDFARRYPGDSGTRQPVHTVYGGAHLFKADSAAKLATVAQRHFATYFEDFVTLARVLGLPAARQLPVSHAEHRDLLRRFDDDRESLRREAPEVWLAATVHQRVQEKLHRQAVEDFRIDFEDGFGHRPDAEEDAEAVRAAGEAARGMKQGTLPPFLGIRIKPFSQESRARSLRTLDLFVTTMVSEAGGLPDNFVVTLPKVGIAQEVEALVETLAVLERATGLGPGALKMELMVETPQSLIGAAGDIPLARWVEAAAGRCVGAHFGVYDYTAYCGIIAAHQGMRHPACDFARHMMQVSLAGTGVRLSDGATNLMPVGPHRAQRDGPALTAAQLRHNRQEVHRISKVNYDDVRHSLWHGFYQGWDLHPAQLGIRYAAVYGFFLEGLEAATGRLSQFIDKAAQATLLGDVFDDAATGQALLNFFLSGLSCGALTEEEALKTGLDLEEFQTRSFKRIIEGRRHRHQ